MVIGAELVELVVSFSSSLRAGQSYRGALDSGGPPANLLFSSPRSVRVVDAQTACVYRSERYRFRSSSRTRNDLPIRTAGRFPPFISLYTVIVETRRYVATSRTVR